MERDQSVCFVAFGALVSEEKRDYIHSPQDLGNSSKSIPPRGRVRLGYRQSFREGDLRKPLAGGLGIGLHRGKANKSSSTAPHTRQFRGEFHRLGQP